ncbi:MAG: hypothetical protein HC805_08445, partial [Alkalinema sp. RL_2_19]|nr:hypothetical protein [Alkalinema sp. RL_2_19]
EEFLSYHPDDEPAAAPRNNRAATKQKVPQPLPPEPVVETASNAPIVVPSHNAAIADRPSADVVVPTESAMSEVVADVPVVETPAELSVAESIVSEPAAVDSVAAAAPPVPRASIEQSTKDYWATSSPAGQSGEVSNNVAYWIAGLAAVALLGLGGDADCPAEIGARCR